MNFYIMDDLKEIRDLQAQPGWNSNARYTGNWCDAWEVDRKNGDYTRCPLCGRPVSMCKWEEPRKMRLSNTRYPDRLSSWLTEPLVISERFMNGYIQAGLSGILSFSKIDVVKVARRKAASTAPPDYYLAELCYSKTVRVDPQKTIIHGQKYGWSCAVCNPFGTTCDSLEHLVLHTADWDGTDIFRVYAVGTVCSQKFHDFINANQFTNFNLVPVSEYKR